MRKGPFARRIRPESLRFTHHVLRICLAKQAKLFTSSLGKMNHPILLFLLSVFLSVCGEMVGLSSV